MVIKKKFDLDDFEKFVAKRRVEKDQEQVANQEALREKIRLVEKAVHERESIAAALERARSGLVSVGSAMSSSSLTFDEMSKAAAVASASAAAGFKSLGGVIGNGRIADVTIAGDTIRSVTIAGDTIRSGTIAAAKRSIYDEAREDGRGGYFGSALNLNRVPPAKEATIANASELWIAVANIQTKHPLLAAEVGKTSEVPCAALFEIMKACSKILHAPPGHPAGVITTARRALVDPMKAGSIGTDLLSDALQYASDAEAVLKSRLKDESEAIAEDARSASW